MPGHAGSVGFDRARLEYLRARSLVALDAARSIQDDDWHEQEAMASLRATIAFVEAVWIPTIDAILALDALTKTVAGTRGGFIEAVVAAAGLGAPPGSVASSVVGLPFASMPLADLLDVLDEIGRDVGPRWPLDADDRFITSLDGFDTAVRAQLLELARRTRADPSIIDAVLSDALGGRASGAAELLGLLAADGHLDSITTLRVAAALSVGGASPRPTGQHQLRHHAINDIIRGRLDALADTIDPAVALDALEHPEVRTWLVLDSSIDETTAAFLLAIGIHGSVADDPSLATRSRDAWLAFIDLAERFGAERFNDGVAEGLAIGATVHLPSVVVARNGLVVDPHDDPISYAGAELTAEQLSTLFGSIIVSEPAAALLLEFVYDTAVDDVRAAVAEQDRRPRRADVDEDSLRYRLTSAVRILDLVADDAIEVQQGRWNDIARARANGTSDLASFLAAAASIVPVGGTLASTSKSLFRASMTAAKSNVDGDAPTIELADGLAEFETQLGREIVVSIAGSSSLRELVGFDQLDEATRNALDTIAADPPDVDVHTLDGFLRDLGVSERDIGDILGKVTELLRPIRLELDERLD
ncbi:MAG: hypothetical protein AAFP84_15625 [Actinomycetota bacterium]